MSVAKRCTHREPVELGVPVRVCVGAAVVLEELVHVCVEETVGGGVLVFEIDTPDEMEADELEVGDAEEVSELVGDRVAEGVEDAVRESDAGACSMSPRKGAKALPKNTVPAGAVAMDDTAPVSVTMRKRARELAA